jgi:release factor glutamine methyltransferase
MLTAKVLQDLISFYKSQNLESPMLEAQILLQDVLGVSLTELLMGADQEISQEKHEQILAFSKRRVTGEPLAYILGYKDFYKYRFVVNSSVLIPRPETELIVEEALKLGAFESIADLGCGSGCIGLSLLKENPVATLWSCDISEKAVAVAKQNAQELGLLSRWEVEVSDVTSVQKSQCFDLIVSNPPYIDHQDPRLEAAVKKFEPQQALFAAQSGLQFYQQWVPWSFLALKSSGWLLMEVGDGQASKVEKIFVENRFINIKICRDLSGIERVVMGQKDSNG